MGQAQVGKQVGGGDGGGGVVGRCGGAVGESALYAARVYGLRFREGGETAFCWESVLLEPVQESSFAEDTGIGILRCMDMSIYRLVSQIH